MKTTISFQSVSFSYGDGDVLLNLSIDIPHHSFFCVIGPSGSGKTTLIRLLLGLENPNAGVISVAGLAPDVARRRGLFAYDPQLPSLLPWLTVKQNICLPLRIRSRAISEKRVNAVLDQVGLLASAHKRPGELSGGMLARAALARAWVDDDAQYIILDEPFASLDELRREELASLLRHLWRITPKTIVYITHDISEAIWLGSHILPLRRGLLGENILLFSVTDHARMDEEAKSRSGLHNELRKLLAPYSVDGYSDRLHDDRIVLEKDKAKKDAAMRTFLNATSPFDLRVEAADLLKDIWMEFGLKPHLGDAQLRQDIARTFVEMWREATGPEKSKLAFRICDFFSLDSEQVQDVFRWIEGQGKEQFIQGVKKYMGNRSYIEKARARCVGSRPAAQKLQIISLLACPPHEHVAALEFLEQFAVPANLKPEFDRAIDLVKSRILEQKGAVGSRN